MLHPLRAARSMKRPQGTHLRRTRRGHATMPGEKPTVYTIGHSSRGLGELLELLRRYGAEAVVDVRRYPGSRRYPWFRREELERSLAGTGMRYIWMGDRLGGFRRFGKDAPRELEDLFSCLESRGFRAYAAYLYSSPAARAAVEELLGLAREARVVVLCRERLPWRCHRWILSDALVMLGARVIHVIELGRTVEHRLTRCAVRSREGLPLYPGGGWKEG